MAKVPFTKLGLTKNQDVNIVVWNEQNIEVKQYLPITDKLNLISNVINMAHDSAANFSNPVKIKVYATVEALFAYTNINFTDKQKEDIIKLYDLVTSSGLFAEIKNAMKSGEFEELLDIISLSVDAIYSYQNSVLGILDSINTDYSNLNLDATEIQKKLADPENMELLKGILAKLG